MSSTFYIVCLSHDPAIEAREYNRPESAEAAVQEGVSGHADCDLMLIRTSGAPVEVGCPGHGFADEARPRPHWCRTRHAHTEWVDVGWLHVLTHARLAGALPDAVARHHDLSCWTEQRLWRLREQLGLQLPQQVDESRATPGKVVHEKASPQVEAVRGADEPAPSATGTLPGWRQNADGTRTVPFYDGTLTASADVSNASLDLLQLFFAGPAVPR